MVQRTKEPQYPPRAGRLHDLRGRRRAKAAFTLPRARLCATRAAPRQAQEDRGAKQRQVPVPAHIDDLKATEMRTRPRPDFREINAFIRRALDSVGTGGKKETQDIQILIEEAREDLSGTASRVGEWEEFELHQAHTLLDAGFARLAILSVGKAVAIQSLSREEYAFGLDLVRKQARAAAAVEISAASAKVVRLDTASDLKTNEALIATRLEEVQKETARHLLERQVATATELEKKNMDEAYELFLAQEKAMETLQQGEEKILAHMDDLERTLSWMAGGYMDQAASRDSVFDEVCANIQDTQRETAQLLKGHQERIAIELAKHQKHLAASLSSSEKSDALRLKTEQDEAAAQLRERQQIKAIKRSRTDEDGAS